MKFDNNISNLVHDRFRSPVHQGFRHRWLHVFSLRPWHKKEESGDLTCMDFREFEWSLDTIRLTISR
jgi:hypothetical protein